MTRSTTWMVAVFVVVAAFAIGMFITRTSQVSEAITSNVVGEPQPNSQVGGPAAVGKSLRSESKQTDVTGVLKPQAQGGGNNILLMPVSLGNVGIGTSNPTAFVEIESDDSKVVAITNSVDEQSNFEGHRARPGPSIVQENDHAAAFRGKGFDGVNFRLLGGVRIVVDGTPGVDDVPGRIMFRTTADGDTQPTTRMVVKNDGKIGIGTMTLEELFCLESDDSDVIMNTISADPTQSSSVGLFRARAGPAVLENGDFLGGIRTFGFDGTDYQRAARIHFAVDGEPGPNDMPGRIQFLTTPDGANDFLVRMTIKTTAKSELGG